MHRLLRFFIFSCLCVLGALSVRPVVAAGNMASFTVMADPSLTVPLNLIAREYSLKHNISITTVFSSTRTQLRDIERGEEATVIIAANTSWIDKLQQKGLIDVYSRTNIARNRLVLAGSQFEVRQVNLDTAPNIAAFTDEPKEFMLAMGNPAFTSEGSYAIDALDQLTLEMTLEPHYSFFRNMYQLIDTIHRYRAMGIVFRSDALLFPNIREISAFRPDAHRPILYQGAVVAGENMELGREFLTYLNTDAAHRIFKAYGMDPAI